MECSTAQQPRLHVVEMSYVRDASKERWPWWGEESNKGIHDRCARSATSWTMRFGVVEWMRHDILI